MSKLKTWPNGTDLSWILIIISISSMWFGGILLRLPLNPTTLGTRLLPTPEGLFFLCLSGPSTPVFLMRSTRFSPELQSFTPNAQVFTLPGSFLPYEQTRDTRSFAWRRETSVGIPSCQRDAIRCNHLLKTRQGYNRVFNLSVGRVCSQGTYIYNSASNVAMETRKWC